LHKLIALPALVLSSLTFFAAHSFKMETVGMLSWYDKVVI
jgi:hypothetical protein